MSEERFADLPGGIRLCYRDLGAGEPVLLVTGLSYQLIHWPEALVAALVHGGHRVIAFDNRDSGRSTHPEGPVPTLRQRLRRQAPPGAYDLGDMAADAVALLDDLAIDRAHVVGMSMGGMIGQVMAARHPARVRSLTSIISTTGAPRVGQPGLRMLLQFTRKPARTRADYVARGLQIGKMLGGRAYPAEPGAARDLHGRAWDRGDPRRYSGVGRQLGAIFASGDRSAELARIAAPTLVIHGDRDPLVHPSGGRATARAIPGARHVTIPGMGHDIPPALAPRLAELILDHTRRSGQGTVPGGG